MQEHGDKNRSKRSRRMLLCLGLLAATVLAIAPSGYERLVDSHLDTSGLKRVLFRPDVPHEVLRLGSGTRHLIAIRVGGVQPDAPLILIFHGNGENVGDWSAAQTFLFDHGFSSLVFDYSGYGDSTGKPTIDRLRQDGQTAYAAALDMSPGRHVFILAHSLGCNIALDSLQHITVHPTGYAFWGCMASLRSTMARTADIPRWLVFLVPDRWNNLRAISLLRQPVMLLHGMQDDVMTLGDTQLLARHAASGTTVREIPGASHNALYRTPNERNWGPIMSWARTPGLGSDGVTQAPSQP